jgi:hypothetical protein
LGCRTGPSGYICWQASTASICHSRLYPRVRDYEFGYEICLQAKITRQLIALSLLYDLDRGQERISKEEHNFSLSFELAPSPTPFLFYLPFFLSISFFFLFVCMRRLLSKLASNEVVGWKKYRLLYLFMCTFLIYHSNKISRI